MSFQRHQANYSSFSYFYVLIILLCINRCNAIPAPTVTSVNPTTQAIGSIVTINGANFVSGSTTVTLGGTACGSVTFVNTGQVTCTVGVGTGLSVTAAATTAGGTGSLTLAFSYGPTIASLSPTTQVIGGNVVFTGANFVSGMTAALGGTACSSVAYTSSASITCTVGSGTGLLVSSTGTANGATGTLAGSFSYGPTITSISPTTQAIAGNVVFTGTNFVNGMTASLGGTTCSTTTYTSSTSITCKVPAGSGVLVAASGTANGAIGTLASSFSYGPTVTGITPATTEPIGTTITIGGTNFQSSGTTATIGGTACTVTYVSATQITCPVPAGGSGVAVPVSVTAGSITGSLAAAFSYGPTITSIAPTTQAIGGNVVFTGTNFVAGMTATLGGTSCSTVSYTSATSITCTVGAGTGLSVATTATANSITATLASSFSYGPTITSLNPTTQAIGSTVVITGTNFVSGMTASLGGTACSSVAYASSTSITCTVGAGSGVAVAAAGTANGATGTLAASFSYGPTVSTLAPTTQAIGSNVVFTGTNFVNGMSAALGGTPCSTTTYSSSTSITCTVGAGTGLLVSATATSNGVTGTKAAAFSYGPTVTGVTPATTEPIGTTITISGTNFVAGSTASIGGTACVVTYVSSVQLTCPVPAGGSGVLVTVTVTANAAPGSLTSAFSYGPTLSSVSPSTQAIGATVTINGANFVNGATAVTLGGVACSSVTYVTVNKVTCTVGSGTGLLVATAVIINSITANLAASFSYGPTVTGITPATTEPIGTTITIAGTNFVAGSTASIGGTACVVTYVSSVQLTCPVPAGGSGVLVTVTVTANAAPGSLTSAFSYGPTLSSVSPSTQAIGATVTINGANFVSGSTAVLLGGISCSPVAYISASQVSCSVGSGTGLLVTASATINSITANLASAFSYGPTISSFSPSTQAIGLLITINGANFVSGSTTVKLGGTSCSPVTWTSTALISCTVGSGSGLNTALLVTVNGISASSTFSYAPTVSSYSPNPGQVGATLVVNGANFVINSTVVTIGASVCSILSMTTLQISCTIPYGVGYNLPLNVSVPGFLTVGSLFAYPAPIISAISPTSGPTAGGFLVVVNGSNFASNGNYVTLAGSNCSVTSETTTQIQCTASVGSGLNALLVVSVAGQNGTINTFNFFAPTINFVDPPDGYTLGEFALTLIGSNFAPTGNIVTMAGSSCPVTSESTSQVQCLAAGGSGSNVVIAVNSNGQTASSTQFSYTSYAVVGCYSNVDVNGISYLMPMSTYSTSYSTSLNYVCASSIASAPSIFNFRFYALQAQYLNSFGSTVIMCSGLSDYSSLVPASSTNCPSGLGTPPYVFIYALQGLPCSAYTQTGYSVTPATASVAFGTVYTATCAVGYVGTAIGNVTCAGAINQGFYTGCTPLCPVPTLVGYNISQTGYVNPLSYINATCASGYAGKVTGTMQCNAAGLTFTGSFAGCVQLCPVPNITGYNISQSGLVLPLSYLNASCATGYNGTVTGTVQCIAGSVFVGSFNGCYLLCPLYSQTGYSIVPSSTSGYVANLTSYSASCASGYIPASSTCIFSAASAPTYPLSTSGCGTTPGTSFTIAAAVFTTSGTITTTGGYCLDVNVGSCTSTTPYKGCQIGEWTSCTGGSNQLWTYNSATAQLISGLSASACVDMTGGNMYLQPCGFSANQVIVMSANSNQMQVGTGVTGSVHCNSGANIGSFAGCIPQLFPAYTCYYDVMGTGSSVRTLYGASPAGCSFAWSSNSGASLVNQNNIQIQQCITTAVSQCAGYSYVGIEYGTQVFCGNVLAAGAYTLPQSSCAAGNGGSVVGPVLGGGWIMSIFALQNFACYNDTSPTHVLPYFATALSFSTSGAMSSAAISTGISQCQSACSAYYLAGITNGGSCYCGNTVLLTGQQPLGMNLQMCSTGGTGGADGLARSGSGLGDPQNMAIYYTTIGLSASYASR